MFRVYLKIKNIDHLIRKFSTFSLVNAKYNFLDVSI